MVKEALPKVKQRSTQRRSQFKVSSRIHLNQKLFIVIPSKKGRLKDSYVEPSILKKRRSLLLG